MSRPGPEGTSPPAQVSGQGISVRGVGHAFGERTVLREVDLELTERRIAVIGANGSGKSTLARMLNGLVVPDRGEVLVHGLDTRDHGAAVRRLVGFVFTDPDAQILMPTVAEDVAFSLRRARLTREETARRVAEALARFGLGDHADAPAHLLSGGQKQLLALTSVLITEPRVLVMDEPTTLLDLRNTLRVQAAIDALEQQVVLVTHDLSSFGSFDRALVVHDGRIVADGSPTESVAFYRRLVG
jgi:biotin transport system ATP-binding protein